MLEAQGVVTPAAAAEFGKAGEDPRARYYLAEAALQRGDTEKGVALLHALLADAPAEAPWRNAIIARLEEIAPDAAPAAPTAPGCPPPATSPPPGRWRPKRRRR